MQHDAGNNILFYGTAEPGVHDVIVDHCSVFWGSDTQFDWYGSYLDRATFQWNIIAEADMGSHNGGYPYLNVGNGGPVRIHIRQALPRPPVALYPVSQLSGKVLAAVGACKPSRDVLDQRVVKSVRDKTSTYRAKTLGGPWPDLAAGAPSPPPDSDHDGMPDAWEKAHGLDRNNPSDGAAPAANGYTNVENYLNELAGDIIPQRP